MGLFLAEVLVLSKMPYNWIKNSKLCKNNAKISQEAEMNGFKVKIRLHLIYGIFDVVVENVSSFASRLSV